MARIKFNFKTMLFASFWFNVTVIKGIKKLVDCYLDFNSGLGFFYSLCIFFYFVFIHTYTYAETFSF